MIGKRKVLIWDWKEEEIDNLMVFRGCMNNLTVSVNNTARKRRKGKREREKELAKANMPQCSKHLIFFINQLNLSFEYIEHIFFLVPVALRLLVWLEN